MLLLSLNEKQIFPGPWISNYTQLLLQPLLWTMAHPGKTWHVLMGAEGKNTQTTKGTGKGEGDGAG